MPSSADNINGWEVRLRADGGYGVYDYHGLVDGPFGRREEAMAAALRLPKPRPCAFVSAPSSNT
jgi:hypothetical protein